MIPNLLEPLSFKEFAQSLNSSDSVLFADINSENNSLEKVLQSKEGKFVLFIGPEGDFSPQERKEIANDNKFKSFSLGKNILRSETAAMSGLVLVNFLLN